MVLAGVPVAAPVVLAHGAGVDAAVDAQVVGGEQQQVQAEAVDGVVVDGQLRRVVAGEAPLAALHDHGDEGVHALQGAAQGLGIGDGAFHEVDVAGRRRQVEDAQLVDLLQVGRDDGAHVPGAAHEQDLHEAWLFPVRIRSTLSQVKSISSSVISMASSQM